MENKKDSENREMTFFEFLNVLGSKIKKGCQGLLNAFLKFIRFIYKNIALIFFTIIIFIAIGIALHFIMPQKYKATGTLFTYGSSASLVKEILSKEELELSEDMISEIKSYYYVDVKKDGIPDYVYFKPDKKLASDTNVQLMNDRLFLEIDVLDTEDPTIVENKIINILNTNPLLIKNFDFYKLSIQEDLDICVKEIQRIDSLSNKTYFDNKYNDIQVSGGVLTLGRTSTQLFYEDLFKLQERKATLSNSLQELESPVDFPAGITIDKQSGFGIKSYILMSILTGFFIGIFVALFYRNRKRISAYMNS